MKVQTMFKTLFVYSLLIGSTATPCFSEVRITMAEALRAVIKAPQPEYAPLAKLANIKGDVVVEVKISPEGDVAEVQPVSGNSLLINPVVKALKLWKFKPFRTGGKSTGAITNLRFSFKE
jgi:periplasmic protein TonB